MNPLTWQPATLPAGLEGHAVRCPQCVEPRECMKTLLHVLDHPGRQNVRLQKEGYNIHPHALTLHCEACLDTGWLLSDELKELLRRAEGLLKRPAVVDEIVQIRDDEEGGES